ncbi:type II toxin-antitoxin system HigB family toxin [Cytophaga sp. FL35]|nr:type II toxin-antitoxin system HigB family toxin [Cytophaga sp. FL35]
MGNIIPEIKEKDYRVVTIAPFKFKIVLVRWVSKHTN